MEPMIKQIGQEAIKDFIDFDINTLTTEDLSSKMIKAKYSSVNTIHGAKDQVDQSEAIKDSMLPDDILILITTN
jgi:hypothetical protein